MTVSAAPAQPGGITGVASYLKVAQVLHIYSSVIGATLYTWTVPTGAIITQVKVLLPLPLIIHVRQYPEILL